MNRRIARCSPLPLRCPFAALAHHGWSEYDATQALKLTGTIEESGYEHPHGHVKLKTPAARRGWPCSRRRRAWRTAG